MNRLKLFILLISILLLLFCRKKNPNEPPKENIHPQVDVPWPSLADSPWPIPYGNAQCTARSKYPGPSEGKIEWIFTEEKIGRVYTSPVIGEDGTIYVSDDRQLYAIHPDGTMKWRFTMGRTTESSVMIGAGDVIYYTTGSTVRDPSYQGYLYALDSNGNVQWEYQTIDMPYSYSSALGIDGTIYFTDLGGYLHALNSDGSLKWETRGTSGFKSAWAISIAISPDGSTLYVPGIDSTMNAVNAQTGELIWQIPTGYGYFARIAPLVDNDGNIYFFGREGDNNYVYSAKKDGEIRWKYTHEELYTLAFRSGMNMDYNGNIYFCSGHEIYSLNYDGALRWKIPYIDRLDPHTPILSDINKNIFVALSSEKILSYDYNGNKRFDVSIEEFGNLVIGALSNGRLYVGSSQKLICIK